MRPQILAIAEQAGHRVFERGQYNLNLIAERQAIRPDVFDDRLHLVFRTGAGWQHLAYDCTTDPGLYWLRHPMRIDGTAVIAPGQYRGSHAIGRHRGRYTALVQAGPVDVFRDADRDGQIDLSGPRHTGMFGINIHRASSAGRSRRVHKWSAGCIVVRDPGEFEHAMKIAKHSTTLYGPRISLTVVDTRT